MSNIDLPYNWNPRPYQDPLWNYLMGGGKRAVIPAHRRWGKDVLGLNWTAVAAHRRRGVYWHMLPEASQARKAIWDAVDEFTEIRLIDQAFPPVIRATTREADMFIRLKCGSTWQVVGSDNYNSLIGSPPVGVLFSEYAYGDPLSWQKISPILLNNKGWALFISTPFGRNHFHGLYEYAKTAAGWFTLLQTVKDTGVITPEQIEEELRQLTAQRGIEEAQAIIAQEYFCSFDAAIPGAYFASIIEEMERSTPPQITSVPYDPNLGVETWWDLGVNDDTAIWFVQRAGRETRIIDYYEAANVGLDHYANVLREKNYRYLETSCLMPHDAGHRQMTNEGGVSMATKMSRAYGFKTRVVEKTRSLVVSVNQMRGFLRTCVFDATRCADGLNKLRQYRRKWNKDLKRYFDEPLHDFSSHAASAFRTGVEGSRGLVLSRDEGVNYSPFAPAGMIGRRAGFARVDDDPLGRF